jgi:hypothetical protein
VTLVPLKPEHQYRKRVHKYVPGKIHRWSIHDSFTAGVPDLWYSCNKGDLWVEYKYYPKLPRKIDVTGTKNPKLSHLQQHWLKKRHAEGRNVGVIVGCPAGGIIMPGITWMNVFTAEDVIDIKDVAGWIINETLLGSGDLL